MRFKPTNTHFRNTLCIFRLEVNLISVFKLCTKDYVGEFD